MQITATETEEIPEQRELLDSLKAKAKVSSIPKHDTVRPVVSEGGDVVERDIAITKRAKVSSCPITTLSLDVDDH